MYGVTGTPVHRYTGTRKGALFEMKEGIHPEYVECTITCTCGAVYHSRSTKPAIHVDICARCHPFFTGQQKLMDTAGRVEKFRRKYAKKPAAK